MSAKRPEEPYITSWPMITESSKLSSTKSMKAAFRLSAACIIFFISNLRIMEPFELVSTSIPASRQKYENLSIRAFVLRGNADLAQDIFQDGIPIELPA